MVHPANIGRQPGRKLDRYELIAEIASGGMGTVYLARLEGVGGFQRLFAIKLMHPHLAKDPQFVAMLLDEARLAARIHHPNAVGISDVCESDVGYYLVMEYIEGFTLDDILEHPELSQEDRVKLGLRILYDGAVGLHAAHQLSDDSGQSLNLVHRDVSPQNILVGVDGVGRITDFGVARAAARITTSRPGMIKGKPCYMAPEQALGQDLDRRADVFALGIILWETLCGKMLFYSEAGDAAMLARVLHDEIESPRRLNVSVTEALEAVVMKSLDRDPEARYQSARAFAEALLDAARDAKLIVSNHQLSDQLQTIFADDVKQRRASIQRHLEELGTGSSPVASDVFEQVPKLEQRPSFLAPAPDSGAWHEASQATAMGKRSSKELGTADTKAAIESVAPDSGVTATAAATAPKASKRSPLMALAGIVLVVLGTGAWVVAGSDEGAVEAVGDEVVPGAGTGTVPAANAASNEAGEGPEPVAAGEGSSPTASAPHAGTGTVPAANAASNEAGEGPEPVAAGEGSSPTASAPHAETQTPPRETTMRPRMRPSMSMSMSMGVVVESNPYLQ